ncbi:hypothetical protein D1Z98_01795 [Riemerella anatipestifer]|uniref:hypothetical protein n=1 Tax=Riemerella anatipestifer TaxID=34085 RepID=UPI00129E6BCE|nr:hypothetical protein [Riemerella anatipestifer]MRM93742.1 hypothetical protein [Riemerella anatipestifer]
MENLTINENLKRFLNNKHEAGYNLNKYKSSKVESFKYKDGTQLICIPPNSTLEVGDDFRDTKGFLYVVTDVLFLADLIEVFLTKRVRGGLAT